jgi:hypothetical protein
MQAFISFIHKSHGEKSSSCKAIVIDKEKRLVADSSVQIYVILGDQDKAEPQAEHLMRDIPFSEQVRILRESLGVHLKDKPELRALKDYTLLLEQLDIRLRRVEQFILSLTGNTRIVS